MRTGIGTRSGGRDAHCRPRSSGYTPRSAPRAPDEVITEAADLVEKVTQLLEPYYADEWASPSGRRMDLPNRGNLLAIPLDLHKTDDGRTRLQVRVQDETAWLSLNQMAELFQRDKSVVSRHISNVFDEGELRREATVAKSATVQTEGGKQMTREIEFFNLDVIISVGYRVNRGGARSFASGPTRF